MSTITPKTSKKAITVAKSANVAPAEQPENVIVQKTYCMAETLKKYPLPGN